MLDPQEFHTADRWENRAIDELCPHLDRATRTGAPAVVAPFPTALTQAELVAVAVRLCNGSRRPAAVLVGPAIGGLTFVPFALPRQARQRARADLHYSRRHPGSRAALADVTI